MLFGIGECECAAPRTTKQQPSIYFEMPPKQLDIGNEIGSVVVREIGCRIARVRAAASAIASDLTARRGSGSDQTACDAMAYIPNRDRRAERGRVCRAGCRRSPNRSGRCRRPPTFHADRARFLGRGLPRSDVILLSDLDRIGKPSKSLLPSPDGRGWFRVFEEPGVGPYAARPRATMEFWSASIL